MYASLLYVCTAHICTMYLSLYYNYMNIRVYVLKWSVCNDIVGNNVNLTASKYMWHELKSRRTYQIYAFSYFSFDDLYQPIYGDICMFAAFNHSFIRFNSDLR